MDSTQNVDQKFKNQFRPSSTINESKPPNLINLMSPSNNSKKLQLINESNLILSYEKSKKRLANDSKLIISHDRPFSPPQK
jgi:hypothetical protein